jgi:ABC-type transport system substrate-binding protein
MLVGVQRRAKITSIDRAALSTKRQAKALSGDLLHWSTPNRSVPSQIVTIINALHHGQAPLTSTAVPELDQMLERALASTDVQEVEKLIGDMHRFLYHNAHNITIGEIHTNYAANKKVPAWNLGRNLYVNNLRGVVRQ